MPTRSTAFGLSTALVGLSLLSACHPTPPPPGCTYSVVPSATPMTASGGNIRLLVTTAPTCTWSYQGNDPWITVIPDADSTGQPGTGNGTVMLTAVNNSGATRRSGTATV